MVCHVRFDNVNAFSLEKTLFRVIKGLIKTMPVDAAFSLQRLQIKQRSLGLDGQGKSLRITVSLKTRGKLGHLVFEKKRPTVSRKNARKIGIPG